MIDIFRRKTVSDLAENLLVSEDTAVIAVAAFLEIGEERLRRARRIIPWGSEAKVCRIEVGEKEFAVKTAKYGDKVKYVSDQIEAQKMLFDHPYRQFAPVTPIEVQAQSFVVQSWLGGCEVPARILQDYLRSQNLSLPSCDLRGNAKYSGDDIVLLDFRYCTEAK